MAARVTTDWNSGAETTSHSATTETTRYQVKPDWTSFTAALATILFMAARDADELHGDAGADTLIGDSGADRLWGGADADRFVFKGYGVDQDTVMDFQDGLDRFVFEGNGVKSYSSSGAVGTVFAYDQPDGNVLIRGLDGTGNEISVLVEDPYGTLQASDFTSTDFLFA